MLLYLGRFLCDRRVIKIYICKEEKMWHEIDLFRLQRLRETHNALQLSVLLLFLLVLSVSRVRDFGILSRYFWFWNSLNIANWGGGFSLFRDIHVRIYIRIDISISIGAVTTTFGDEVHLEELTLMILIKQVLKKSSRQDHNYISTTRVPMVTKLSHGCDFPWWVSNHKATKPFKKVVMWENVRLLPIILIRPFGHVVLLDHITSYSHYISTTTMPMAITLGRKVTLNSFYP